MNRRTDNITRVDVRLPNHLYDRISEIAIHHYHAKIHHRSGKPEVTPTILELIEIGIAHLESALPVTDEAVTEQLRQAISQLDSRLTEVESKLSGVNITAPNPSSDTSSNEKILTDIELSNLLNVSNLLIRDYRVKGKKPKGQVLAKALTEEWEIKGEGWVKRIDR